VVDLNRFRQRAEAAHAAASNTAAIQDGPMVWKGPMVDGITYSMLTKFLTCRERFRLLVIDGLRAEEKFDHRIEYGHLWHTCEEALSAKKPWEPALEAHYKQLQERFKLHNIAQEIRKWYMVCRTQFPVYVAHWQHHKDNTARLPLLQEYTFDTPYDIGGDRKVRLRGKIDAGDLIGKAKTAGIYVQENKTKSDIEEDRIKRQVSFDLQTGLYMAALRTIQQIHPSQYAATKLPPEFFKYPIKGVRYNVVRRPLSGGKGSITQKKGSKNVAAETDQEFYARLKGIMDGTGTNKKGEDYPGPEYFFMRWQAEFTPADITRFEQRVLKPILHQLCDWWSWVYECKLRGTNPFDKSRVHWQHPFGSQNMIDEGFSHELDEYMRTGSTVGIRQVDRLFEEL
jgi:hypothetical protein